MDKYDDEQFYLDVFRLVINRATDGNLIDLAEIAEKVEICISENLLRLKKEKANKSKSDIPTDTTTHIKNVGKSPQSARAYHRGYVSEAGNVWDERALQHLMRESIEGGMSNQELGKKYSVTPQRIYALLKKAKKLSVLRTNFRLS